MCKFVLLDGDLIKIGFLKDPNADTAFGKSNINRNATDIISRLIFVSNHPVIIMLLPFQFNKQQQTSSTCFECVIVTLIR